MTMDAVPGTVTPGSEQQDQSGTLTVNRADLQKMIHGTIMGVLDSRLKTLPTVESIGSIVDQKLEAFKTAQPAEPPAKQAPNGNAAASAQSPEKALEDRVNARLEEKEKAWQAKFSDLDKQRKAAEDKARDTQARAKVRESLSKHIQVAQLDTVMESLYDVRKRFIVGEDGAVTVNFKRDGYEDNLALDKGVEELLKSDLKPFLAPLTRDLPPAGPGALLRGNGRPLGSGHETVTPMNPVNGVLMEVARSLESRAPVAAENIARVAHAPVPKVQTK